MAASLLGGAVLGGCAPALTCREPDISSFTAEGVPDALCDVTFSRCEDDSTLTVSCTNATFSGDYDCQWLWYRTGRIRLKSGQFDSPDFCVVDAGTMADELAEAGGPRVTIE